MFNATRQFRILVRTNKHFGGTKRVLSTKFGYECATRVNVEHDQTFLEKSIRNGCRMVLGKSGSQSEQIYELLHDLTDFDAWNLKDFKLGHVLKYSSSKGCGEEISLSSPQVAEWKADLDKVREVLCRRNKDLDFVSVQVPLLQCLKSPDDIAQLLSAVRAHYDAFEPPENPSRYTESLGSDDDDDGAELLLSEENMRELEEQEELKRRDGTAGESESAVTAAGKGGGAVRAPLRLGLDLDSNFFVSSSSGSSVVSELISLLQPLVDSRQCEVLTVACNSMTHSDAMRLIDWCRERGVETVATEVLRADHYRPGLLPSDFNHMTQHKPMEVGSTPSSSSGSGAVQLVDSLSQDESVSERERVRVGHIHAATEDFQMALDRCLTTEKVLLEKLLPKLSAEQRQKIDVTAVCLGHVLVRTCPQFIYPEEWNHVVMTQVEPRLNATMEAMVATSGELSDWTLLHKSMIKYLLASFRQLLQTKALRLSQGAQDILERHNPDLAAFTGVDKLSWQMSLLAARSFNADHVTMAITPVIVDEWERILACDDFLVPSAEQRAAANKTYSVLHQLLVDYNQDK